MTAHVLLVWLPAVAYAVALVAVLVALAVPMVRAAWRSVPPDPPQRGERGAVALGDVAALVVGLVVLCGPVGLLLAGFLVRGETGFWLATAGFLSLGWVAVRYLAQDLKPAVVEARNWYRAYKATK